MKLTNIEWIRNAGRKVRQIPVAAIVMAMAALGMGFVQAAVAQAPSTTTVQGTVYLANGHVGSGTLRLSWPAFATATGQSVVSGSTTATIGPDGFVSVNLAPNLGATPAGLYYTAIFYLSDGTTSTQYWVIPAAAQASLAQVQSQVMPAAQAVQAVSKAYVDQSIAALGQSQLTASGGTLNGPLYLNADPTQGLQAADKHYVDSAVSQANPISVSAANSGQIAYYTGSGTSIGGMSTVPLASGGTGSATAAEGLQNLGGISSSATSRQTMAGPLVASTNTAINAQAPPYNAVCDWVSVNGSIPSGSHTFTSISAMFTAGMVGGTIVVPGAGAAGAALTTTISAFVSSNTITLTAAASTTTNNSAAYYSPSNSDDTARLNSALQGAGGLSASSIPVTSYFMGLVNSAQGKVQLPFGKMCRISNVLVVPPGVTVDLNTSAVLQTSPTSDAFRISMDDITNRSYLGFYGVAFNSITNGSIVGPGNSASTGTGLFLYGVAYGDYENLNILGFKFGLEALESGYNTFKHVFTTYNVVGKYLTARGGANGLPVNITSYSAVGGGLVTLTANNGFEQDSVTIAGCNGSNCPTAMNGVWTSNESLTMPPACEHGNCTTFQIYAPAVSGSGSGLTGVTATPTGSYATLDNTILDDMSDSNSKIGLWCQACGSMGVHKGDYSYNGEAEIVLGSQPGYADPTHTYYVSSITGTFPSGSGCTGPTQPITISGGTLAANNGTPAQAYAWINGSGQVGSVFMVDGGNGYSVLPTTFSVATCATQPTLTAAGTSEVGLGVFDGTVNVNRGLIAFYSARSESVIARNGPNTGYAIWLNGGVSGGMDAVEFDNYCFGAMGGVAPVPYARYARNYGLRNSFVDPGCTGAWDTYSNPASAGDVSAFQNAGGNLTLKLPQGFMTNPSLAVVGANDAVIATGQPTDSFNGAGLHYSNGYAASGTGAGNILIEGNIPSDGSNQRTALTINGEFSIGTGGGAFDVGYCRLQSGRLGISDGVTGGGTCNANGELSASDVYVGAAGLRTGNVPLVAPASPNTAIYNTAHGGEVQLLDQTSGFAQVEAKSYAINGAYQILASTLTGYHGTSGTKVQYSDGTGMSGNLVKWAPDGSTTDGPTPPAGAIVGSTDTQTLTNKSIAGSEINSGVVGTAVGGTGQNESSATGVGQFSSGAYSVSTALANGTTATTQTAGDNSTEIATTAYVATPGAITPTTVTATGLVTGLNDTTRTTSTTIATTGFTTTGLVLPAVPVNTTKSGRCTIYWQMSSTSYTATFGAGMSNSPTGLWGGTSVTYAAGGTSSWLAFTQTASTATAISSAATAGTAGTTYRAEVDFTIQTGATNPVALTLYGQVSNASATLTVGPGSTCYWLP
jgi:hypothetical protein